MNLTVWRFYSIDKAKKMDYIYSTPGKRKKLLH